MNITESSQFFSWMSNLFKILLNDGLQNFKFYSYFTIVFSICVCLHNEMHSVNRRKSGLSFGQWKRMVIVADFIDRVPILVGVRIIEIEGEGNGAMWGNAIARQ